MRVYACLFTKVTCMFVFVLLYNSYVRVCLNVPCALVYVSVHFMYTRACMFNSCIHVCTCPSVHLIPFVC